jgi:hypothetical protein
MSSFTDAEATASRSTDREPPVASAWGGLAPSLVVVVYLLIGSAAYWSMFPDISDHLFGIDADYTQAMWFIAWVPHALYHGLNPLFSNSIYVPSGVNLTESTSSPLLGLFTAPFALVLNPVVRANLLLVLAMPVSATAGFVVLRRWHVWGPAAALGGLIYGFSPYMVGQSVAHIELIFVPLPPFIALTVASILQNQGSYRRLGIWLGLLVTAQYLISPEILATVAVLTVAAVACLAIHDHANAVARLRTMARPVAIASVLTAVLLAYPVWMMLAGPQHFTGPAWAIVNPYHNDLLSFVVPGPLQRISFGMHAVGVRLDVAAGGTAGGYIGIPLLMLAGILAWWSRRDFRMRLAVILMLGGMLLSLGPYLAVNGRLSQIPLPFLILDHVPLLDSILPSRFSFGVDSCLAAVIAFGLDDISKRPSRIPHNGSRLPQWSRSQRSAGLVGVTLVVLVATQLPLWPLQGPFGPQPAIALPPAIRAAIPAGDPVTLSYPYLTFYDMQPMVWQADDGFRFRLLGGYAFRPDSSGGPTLAPSLMSPPGLQRFLAAQDGAEAFGPPLPLGPELVAITRATLSRYDTQVVIVDRSESGSGPVIELFNEAIGPPELSVGQFSLWTGWRGST